MTSDLNRTYSGGRSSIRRPADFFRTIQDYSGEDLSWFWRGWFYTTDVLDQAIDSVAADSAKTMVYLSNKRGLVMPCEVKVTFADAQSDSFNLPIEVWYDGNTYVLPVYDERKVEKVEIDPNHVLPDINRDNNIWELKVKQN